MPRRGSCCVLGVPTGKTRHLLTPSPASAHPFAYSQLLSLIHFQIMPLPTQPNPWDPSPSHSPSPREVNLLITKHLRRAESTATSQEEGGRALENSERGEKDALHCTPGYKGCHRACPGSPVLHLLPPGPDPKSILKDSAHLRL